MAHELDIQSGKAAIAYTGDVPWHGLGQKLAHHASIEQWAVAAGMNWQLEGHPAFVFDHQTRTMIRIPDTKVLQRSDNRAVLGLVSDKYQVVQPRDVLEFFRDVVKAGNLTLDTAGVLRGGRKYWALAKLGKLARIMNVDPVEGYLLLATACDGSLATTAMLTSVRTVCNNTLQLAIRGMGDHGRPFVKVPHSRVFDATVVKAELGLAGASWDQFIDEVDALARHKLSTVEASRFVVELLGDVDKDVDNQRIVKQVLALYQGEAEGSHLKTAKGTAWGVVNSVTQYYDHLRATRSQDARLNRAWFGDGATVKARAWSQALALIG